MAIVLDTSALLAAALGEDGAETVRRRLSQWQTEQTPVYAPLLLQFEFASGLAKALATGRLSVVGLDSPLATLWSAPLRTYPGADLVHDAIEIARELGQRNAYDAFYLALARRIGAELWTIDRAMAANCLALGIAGYTFDDEPNDA